MVLKKTKGKENKYTLEDLLKPETDAKGIKKIMTNSPKQLASLLNYSVGYGIITLHDIINGKEFIESAFDLDTLLLPLIPAILGYHVGQKVKDIVTKNSEVLDAHKKETNELNIPYFLKDENGVYVNCNDKFAEIFLGCCKDEIIGKTSYDLPTIKSLAAKKYEASDKEIILTGEMQIYDDTVECADGISRVYLVNKTRLAFNGKNYVSGTMTDVSQKAKTVQYLIDESYRDPIFEVYNKKFYNEKINQLIENYMNKPLDKHAKFSLIMVDIDDFKKVNDSLGHDIGDIALKEIAGIMKRLTRENDYVFRYGGEEFGIIMENAGKKSAKRTAERIRKQIETYAQNFADEYNADVNPTISAGVEQYLNIFDKSTSIDDKRDEFFKMVDTKLYQAKQNGKNQVWS